MMPTNVSKASAHSWVLICKSALRCLINTNKAVNGNFLNLEEKKHLIKKQITIQIIILIVSI